MATPRAVTDPPPDDAQVGRLANQGALWGVVAQGIHQVLSVVATMILARLLTPADFGLVTASITVLGFVQLALALGWGPAVVRRREADAVYLSSVFWVVTGTGTVLAAAVAAGAPALADLVGISGAAPYLMVLAVSCIPGAAVVVPHSILQRRLQLRAIQIASIVSLVVYVVVQVTLAALGAGAWSVIVGMVAQSVVHLVAMTVAARWLPRPVFRWGPVAEDLRLAGGLLVNNGITYGVRNADYVVVGRLLGPATLGAYYVAYVLPQILRLRATWVAQSVLFPVLARSQADPRRTQQVYDQSQLLLAWVGFPAMVGLAVLARPVVQVFFGSQWAAAVNPLRWLALAALLEFVTYGPPMVAAAQAQVRPMLVTNLVRVVLLVAGVVIAGRTFRTVGAVAAAVFFATLLWAVHQQLTLARPLGLVFAPLLRRLCVLGLLSVAMGAAVGLLLAWVDHWPAVVQLAVCTAAGAVLYFGLGWLLARDLTVPLARSAVRILRSGGRGP
ncbi:MAG: putative polysaccharide transport protein [Actinomycetia bacterium]|nr:putative polysaccharide transport protein [Actinomycetes bacterium]